MSDDTPTFAIVGAVNHGKSSVVSTLAEQDQVRISAMPGETVECQTFWLLNLFRFCDTPGFQNALEAYDELKLAGNTRTPLRVFREFIAQHRGNSDFEAECRLLQPIVDGAGILYVVDGSEPLSKLHLAEMEILRLTGQPRLAIINRRSHDNYVEEWKRKLGSHFNAVREFNAHHATFADRLELLDTLASIEQTWKPKLKQAVALFTKDQETRLADCAETIGELLIFALQHSEVAIADSAVVESPAWREALRDELKQRFIRTVSAREASAHQKIIKIFRHSRVDLDLAGESLFDTGLFSEDTWKAFGLNERQLVAAGAIGGATAGASSDLLTAGHTLFAGTFIGGVIGAAGTYLVGKKRPELKVNMPGILRVLGLGKMNVAGRESSVGPYTATNFPWILLDRAFGTFVHVINRAHARQDRVTINSAQVKAVMNEAAISTARWNDEKRKVCEKFFTVIRKHKLTPEKRQSLRELIRKHLEEVSQAKVDDLTAF